MLTLRLLCAILMCSLLLPRHAAAHAGAPMSAAHSSDADQLLSAVKRQAALRDPAKVKVAKTQS